MLRKYFGLSTAALLVALTLCAGPARAADEEEDPFYEGFYRTTVTYLNTANLSIGIFGDTLEKGVYDKEFATKIAAVHAVAAQDTAKALNKMAKSDGIEEADAESIKRMAKACTLIQKQADALIALIAGDEAQAAEYKKSREATAKAIAEISKEMDDFFKK